MSSKPILVPFKADGTYRLTTDASVEGLDAVLEELTDGKVSGIVGYFSKTVQTFEKKYPPGELELLGIIEALRHIRYLLHGRHFILRTDHISLLALSKKDKELLPLEALVSYLN